LPTPRSRPIQAAPADVDRRRERAVLALVAQGNSQAVLRLVAAWSEQSEPTLAARVAEGRALLELRLVDRALARAREAIEVSPSDKAALRLLAEAYLDRGWPLRARPVLDNLRAAGEDVAALTARLAVEPPRPEALAREVEASGDFAARLGLAEQFMAAGIASRAGVLLEKLEAERPGNSRVGLLRWALAGRFEGTEPLELQVKRALPAILELSAVPEESEHTESLGDTAGLLLDPEPASAPFPTLFKRAGVTPEPLPPASADDEEEKTASSLMPEGAPPPVQLASLSGGGASDTQILMVVGEGEGGPLHRRREEAGRTLNLHEWQASMGMDPLASDLDGVELSEEMRLPGEAPVVEIVPTQPRAVDPGEAQVFDRPIEVIERHPVPDPSLLPEVALDEPEPPARGLGPFRLLVGGAFAVGLVVVLLLLVMMVARATGILDAARTNVDLGRALGSADYAALVEHEQRLAKHAGSPAEEVELARARIVLWSDYNGDRALLDQVDALIANPEGVDAHALAYLRAAQLVAFHNPGSALAAIGREPPLDDEERLVLALAHAGLGDGPAALADLEGFVRPDEPRYRLGRARVLVALGRPQEARAVVTLLVGELPNLIAGRLMELQLREGSPAERAAAAAVFRKTYGALGLSPRQAGEAAWVEASAWIEAGEHERAVKAAEGGIARDGTHRELLLLLAHEDVKRSALQSAARRLTSVVQMYRGDPAVQEALLLVLLELDRITEATAVVEAANPPRQAVFRALLEGWTGGAASAPPEGPGFDGPLGTWARALLAASAHGADAGPLAAQASEALAASPDVLLSRLAPRAAALAATLLPDAEAEAEVARLRRGGLADAGAHVYLARYFEGKDNRALAAQHFDRAADLGPEFGLALYEKGRFYADAKDPLGRTEEAWRVYLGLAPSGPRADRARGVARPGPR
jgi:tetratricopeptide (TPR) repeat protein